MKASIRFFFALLTSVVATGLEASFTTGTVSFLGRGESSTAAMTKAASDPNHTEVPEAQQEGSRLHVPEAGLEFLRKQLELGRQVSQERLENLFDESLIEENEPMSVVNLGGLAAQYKDIDEMVAKLGTQETAKLLVNAEESRKIALLSRPGGAGA